MTQKNADDTSLEPAVPDAAAIAGPDRSDAVEQTTARGRSSGIWLGFLVVLAVLAGAVWWQQQRLEGVSREVAQRLQVADERAARAEQLAQQANTLASAHREALALVDQRLRVTAGELAVLEQAWQAANQGLDQTLLLNDLRRLLTLANQQLVLLGNVHSAIAILESVLQLLEGHNLPQLSMLHQAVLADLSRLRVVPQVDLPGLAVKVDSLIALTSKAPLLVPDRVVPQLSPSQPVESVSRAPSAATPATPTDLAQPWWRAWPEKGWRWVTQTGRLLTAEFADVVSIRRASDPQALLLSEEQAQQMRANVRSMLLSAQLALMMRQSTIWRSELSEVEALLNTRYEPESLDTKAALRLVRELLQAPVSVQVPAITDSLSALETAQRALTVPIRSGGN